MSRRDDDLLARLNALKPSSVKLTPSVDVQTSQPQTVEDKLAARLKSLRSGNHAQPSNNSQGHLSPADALTAQVSDEVEAEKDPIRDWQQQNGDEQSLEELLAELGPDDLWKLDPDDPEHIDGLLKEARDILPPPSEPDHQVDLENSVQSTENHEDKNDKEQQNEDQQDEAAADDYIQQMLAEIAIEKKYGTGDDEQQQPSVEQEQNSQTALDLPSTPSKLLVPPSNDETTSQRDDDLQARFAKLGVSDLDLPSTPTSAPSAKPKVVAKLKPKSNTPQYTDEDIDSWCCICNEDASVRCLGCDGDLYCSECWREGHGSGPGQERGHKAMQYTRKGPETAT